MIKSKEKAFKIIHDDYYIWLVYHIKFSYNEKKDKLSITSYFMYNKKYVSNGSILKMNKLTQNKNGNIFKDKIKETLKKCPHLSTSEIASTLKCNVCKIYSVYMQIKRELKREIKEKKIYEM